MTNVCAIRPRTTRFMRAHHLDRLRAHSAGLDIAVAEVQLTAGASPATVSIVNLVRVHVHAAISLIDVEDKAIRVVRQVDVQQLATPSRL